MIQEFIQTLTSTDLVLTANNRLANYLRGEFDDFQCNSEKISWESPSILPLNAWLRAFYQSNRTEFLRLLSPAQSLLLWERVVGSSLQMASLAQQTWELFQHWELDSSAADSSFANWAGEYADYCDQQALIDEASIAKKVMALIDQNPGLLPSRIFLVGFDNISHIINKLIDKIKLNSDLKICHFELPHSTHSVLELKNRADELQTAARWIKHKIDKNPQGFYGCVVPDLTSMREQAIQVFQEVLGEQAVNVSVGKSLSEYPIIRSALRIIALTQNDSDLFELCAVLRSPFIQGASQEFSERIRQDNQWRESAELYPRYDELSLLDSTPLFQKSWLTFLNFLKTLPEEQKPSAWSKTFSFILEIFAWPGDSLFTESEKLCFERWQECVNEFVQLDSVVEPISLHKALLILNYHIQGTVYQPPTPGASVHLMGILESSGLLFDGLWVLGLDDETWPQPLKPNALLHTDIQRKLKMPRANPEHELDYAKKLLDRLTKAAPEVMFSCPLFEEDKSLQPSPLLNHFPKIALSTLSLADYIPLSRQIFDQRELEKFEDNQAPPVLSDESIRGGTYILKAQATCPFKAFAEIRLHAMSIDEPSLGPDAADRGTLVHEVLANIWKEIGTSRQLHSLSNNELQLVIQTVINNTVESNIPFAKIEKQRLLTLINHWLEYEKKRAPFKVFNIEKNQAITIGGLTLSCRIDRVDQLENKTYVIIDYKTGSSSVNSWFGERPDEPQLPLYCLATDLPISAVVFAECRVDNQQFKGISINPDVLPDVKAIEKYDYEWPDLIAEWKINLTHVADDFLKGKADVDPKNPALSCQYCEIVSLCRIR